jgi:hypothetical protein
MPPRKVGGRRRNISELQNETTRESEHETAQVQEAIPGPSTENESTRLMRMMETMMAGMTDMMGGVNRTLGTLGTVAEALRDGLRRDEGN